MASLRTPQSLSPHLALETGVGILDYELVAEKAESLGRAGARVEASLIELRRFDAGQCPEADRATLVKTAAQAVWGFFVQRELCGMTDPEPAIEFYAIPREVLVRLGER
jgi:hypothetical protein